MTKTPNKLKLKIYDRGTTVQIFKDFMKNNFNSICKDVGISQKMINKLNINIYLRKNIKIDNNITDEWSGFCQSSRIQPIREFKIYVKSTMHYAQMIKTLIHEIVHVKQKSNKELTSVIFSYGERTIFNGNVIKETYNNQPYELEAQIISDDLIDKWATIWFETTTAGN